MLSCKTINQDLPKSNQPIENDKYLFVYNGEIFNWPELINELPSYLDKTEIYSDTKFLEIILKNNLIKKFIKISWIFFICFYR